MYNILWKIEKAQDGNPTLIIENRYIHSKVNPVKEAEKFIYSGINLILIFGFGLGYHVKNIINNNRDSYFLIYEPYDDIFNFSYNLIQEFSKDNLLILNKLDNEKIFNFFCKNNILPNTRIITYSNLGYRSLLPDLEKHFYNTVKKIFETHVQNVLTEENFIPLWSKNFFYNSVYLTKHSLLIPEKLELDEDNDILVIAAAGPTLNEEIKTLKEMRNKITIFAVDTAIKTLLENEIIPDITFSLDAQYYSLFDFSHIKTNELNLILDLIAYPEIAKIFDKCFFLFNENLISDTLLSYFFEKQNIKIKGVNTGGSISDYILSFAISIGFKKIIFVGLDLSYPYLLTHAKGTFFYEKMLKEADFFSTIESKNIQQISKRELIIAPAKEEGKTILTDFVLRNYVFYYESAIPSLKEKQIYIYTTGSKGIKINGVPEINLREFLKNSSSERKEFHYLIKSFSKIMLEKKLLHDFYESFLNGLYSYSNKISEYLVKIESNKKYDFLEEIASFYERLLVNFPFLKKYTIMTEIILNKKEISKKEILWYKHIFHKLLQSLYYLIRKIQRTLFLLNNIK